MKTFRCGKDKLPGDILYVVIKRLLGILVLALMFFAASGFFTIYSQVKRVCTLAMTNFKKDCGESLILVLGSVEYNFRAKNSAVWALGQLADKSALPTLRELDSTLTDSRKCRSETTICKYEVEKAIKWCEKGNVTSWMYKNVKKLP